MTSIPPSLYTSRSASSLSVHSAADTVTSTAPLTAAYRLPPKDYAAAFANLQGQYGMSGDFPVHASMPAKKKACKQAPSTSRSLSGPSDATPAGSRATNPSSRSILDSPELPIATRRTSSEPGRIRPPSPMHSAAVDRDALLEGKEGAKEKPSLDPLPVDLFVKVDDSTRPSTAQYRSIVSQPTVRMYPADIHNGYTHAPCRTVFGCFSTDKEA
ncbi:hypothetical protein DFH06DRAFT_1325662 [Mycena polygramma]|nr:hypothetical protein DFH06DRAFT_1325662 [Mycena polygramma]